MAVPSVSTTPAINKTLAIADPVADSAAVAVEAAVDPVEDSVETAVVVEDSVVVVDVVEVVVDSVAIVEDSVAIVAVSVLVTLSKNLRLPILKSLLDLMMSSGFRPPAFAQFDILFHNLDE